MHLFLREVLIFFLFLHLGPLLKFLFLNVFVFYPFGITSSIVGDRKDSLNFLKSIIIVVYFLVVLRACGHILLIGVLLNIFNYLKNYRIYLYIRIVCFQSWITLAKIITYIYLLSLSSFTVLFSSTAFVTFYF